MVQLAKNVDALAGNDDTESGGALQCPSMRGTLLIILMWTESQACLHGLQKFGGNTRGNLQTDKRVRALKQAHAFYDRAIWCTPLCTPFTGFSFVLILVY